MRRNSVRGMSSRFNERHTETSASAVMSRIAASEDPVPTASRTSASTPASTWRRKLIKLRNAVPVAGRDPKPGGAPLIESIELGNEPFQSLLPGAKACKDGGRVLRQRWLHDFIDKRPAGHDQRTQRREVAVNRSRPDPGALGDLEVGGGSHPLLGMQGGGGLDDTLARGVLPFRPLPHQIFSVSHCISPIDERIIS